MFSIARGHACRIWTRGIGVVTWPPENPTAMTPSSLPADRNLGVIVGGEVIIAAFNCCLDVG